MQLNKRPFIVVLSFCLLALANATLAQTTNYITYKIKQGDNLSALAKTYGTTVGDIMRLNGMNSKSILRIDEEVKIPTKNAAAKIVKPAVTPASIPVQKTTTPAPTAVTTIAITGAPVTHTVAKGESLYRISHNYNVSVDQLKEWNKLSDNNIKLGQVLIVGQQTAAGVTVQKPVVQTPPPVAVNKPSTTVKESQPEASTTTTVAAPEKQTPVTSGTTTTTVTPPPAMEPQPMAFKDKPVTSTTHEEAVTKESSNASPDGYFASFYSRNRSNNALNGDAAAFKTASGWTDRKYYILINNIEPGTIVRVNANSKTIYAKVLGPLPDIKEDAGLVARISNAAVATLGLNDAKFPVTINH